MGQEAIVQFLKKEPEDWFSSKEIGEATGINNDGAITCLRKLKKYNEVNFKEQNRKFMYKYKEE